MGLVASWGLWLDLLTVSMVVTYYIILFLYVQIEAEH